MAAAAKKAFLAKNLARCSDFDDNTVKMKSLKHNQEGLIPLLLLILAIVVAVIIIAYMRVQNAQ